MPVYPLSSHFMNRKWLFAPYNSYDLKTNLWAPWWVSIKFKMCVLATGTSYGCFSKKIWKPIDGVNNVTQTTCLTNDKKKTVLEITAVQVHFTEQSNNWPVETVSNFNKPEIPGFTIASLWHDDMLECDICIWESYIIDIQFYRQYFMTNRVLT